MPTPSTHDLVLRAIHDNDPSALRQVAAEQDVDLNEPDELGTTAVHWAARLLKFEMVTELARLGADIDWQDNQGISPILMMAKRKVMEAQDPRPYQMVIHLFRLGANPDLPDRNGHTARRYMGMGLGELPAGKPVTMREI